LSDLDRATGALLGLGVVLVEGLANRRQVAVQVGAGPLQLVLYRCLALLDLGFDDLFRQRDVDRVQQRLQRLVPGLDDLLHGLGPLELAAGAGPELAKRVELARQLGEVVVETGHFLGLDAVHGDRDVGLLAGEIAARELGPEGGGLPRRQAGHRLVQAVQHGIAAHLVGQAARLRVLDRLAVHRGGQVNRYEVVIGGGPLHRLERGEALLQLAEVFLDLVRGDRGAVHLDRERAQVGQLEVRPDVHLDRERQLLAVVKLGDVHRALAERLHLAVRDRPVIQARDSVVDRLAEHGIPAEPAVDHLRGHLAWPEARDADRLGDLAVCLIQARLQLFEGHFNAQPYTRRAQLFDVSLHVRVTPGNQMVTQR
jgi:hypothetical protein